MIRKMERRRIAKDGKKTPTVWVFNWIESDWKLDDQKNWEEKDSKGRCKQPKPWRTTATVVHVCSCEKSVTKVNAVLSAPYWHPGHLICANACGQVKLNPLSTVFPKWPVPISSRVLDQGPLPARTPACSHIEKGIGCLAIVTEVVHNNLLAFNCHIPLHIVLKGFQHDSLGFVIGRCQD